MKRCTGCGVEKPPEDFHVRRKAQGYHKAGTLMSRCRECRLRHRVSHAGQIGYVPLGRVWLYLDELARRVGQQEASRLAGVTPDTYRNWLRRRVRRVQRRNARAALAALRIHREHGTWSPPKVGRRMSHSHVPLDFAHA